MRVKKQPSFFHRELVRDWNTLKSLDGGKRKAEFIWDYYKIPILFGLTLILTAAIFAHMIWEGQKPCRLRVCAVLNSDESCLDWFRNFETELQEDGIPGTVDLNEDQPFDYSSSYYYLYEIEVMTTISSQRMDAAVCGADMYSYLLALNACLSLEETLPEELFATLFDAGMLDYNTANLTVDEEGNTDPGDGIPGYYAVNLSGTAFAEAYDQPGAPLYAVIISNTEHRSDAVALIRALVQ